MAVHLLLELALDDLLLFCLGLNDLRRAKNDVSIYILIDVLVFRSPAASELLPF